MSIQIRKIIKYKLLLRTSTGIGWTTIYRYLQIYQHMKKLDT
jgi:hypothetical protein